MSYRIDIPPAPKPNRSMETATTPGTIYVTNGGVSNLAIPCWYKILNKAEKIRNEEMLKKAREIPSKISPNMRLEMDQDQLAPIHLREEYPNVEIEANLEKTEEGTYKVQGLEISGIVDDIDDWVIRVQIKANCPEAQIKPQHCHFTIVVKDDIMHVRQVAITGTIVVLPAILA